MKKLTKLASTAMAGALILLSGCCRSGCKNGVVNPLDERDGSFYINGSIDPLRMADDKWNSGDALGVFALQKGTNSLFGSVANAKYTTPDATGKFVAANGGIVLKGTETADIVAYYPYSSEVGNDLTYKIDVADQSDLSKIDLLRGKASNITGATNEAQMTFEHKLALLNLTVTGDNLTNVTASVENVKTNGSYHIAADNVSTGITTGNVSALLKNGMIRMILLPGQELKAIDFMVNGKKMTHTFKTPVALKMGNQYGLTVKFEETGDAGMTIKVTSTNIKPWTEGITDGGTITLPLDKSGKADDNTGGGEQGGGTGGSTPNPGVTPAAKPLFPGSDFEDWDAFTKVLNTSFGLKNVEKSAQGRTGNAAHLTGTATANGYFFSIVKKDFTDSIKSISFYIKGSTQGGKALSVNVYEAGSQKRDGYKPFNIDKLAGEDMTVTPSARNGYNGTINTNGKWVKVTLDCSSFKAGAEAKYGGTLIAFKFGKGGTYDLMIDDITFE